MGWKGSVDMSYTEAHNREGSVHKSYYNNNRSVLEVRIMGWGTLIKNRFHIQKQSQN